MCKVNKPLSLLDIKDCMNLFAYILFFLKRETYWQFFEEKNHSSDTILDCLVEYQERAYLQNR